MANEKNYQLCDNHVVWNLNMEIIYHCQIYMECTQFYAKFNADSVHEVKDKNGNWSETTKRTSVA